MSSMKLVGDRLGESGLPGRKLSEATFVHACIGGVAVRINAVASLISCTVDCGPAELVKLNLV